MNSYTQLFTFLFRTLVYITPILNLYFNERIILSEKCHGRPLMDLISMILTVDWIDFDDYVDFCLNRDFVDDCPISL